MLTGPEGIKVSHTRYSPYGEVLREHSTGLDVYKYKYTAQEEDQTTNLHYYKSRYYDPALGRFISADPIIPNPTRTQAFNRYSYVEGNPVKYVDRIGKFPRVGNPFKNIAEKITTSAIKEMGKSAWNKTKEWTKKQGDKVENWYTDTAGSKDWRDKQWNTWGNKVVIGLLIAIAIVLILYPPTSAAGWWILSCTLAGTIIGGTRGKAVTDPEAVAKGDTDWDWNYAAAGAGIGFAVGVAGQYIIPEIGLGGKVSILTEYLGITMSQAVWYSGCAMLARDWSKKQQGEDVDEGYESQHQVIETGDPTPEPGPDDPDTGHPKHSSNLFNALKI